MHRLGGVIHLPRARYRSHSQSYSRDVGIPWRRVFQLRRTWNAVVLRCEFAQSSRSELNGAEWQGCGPPPRPNLLRIQTSMHALGRNTLRDHWAVDASRVVICDSCLLPCQRAQVASVSKVFGTHPSKPNPTGWVAVGFEEAARAHVSPPTPKG